MVGAVAGSPGTGPTNWGINPAGLTQTIIGLGTENGLQYIDLRFNGTAGGPQLLLSSEGTAQIVAANGQTWTNSFYFKSIAAPTPPNSYNLFTIQRVSGTSGGAFTQAFTPTTTLSRYSQTVTTTNASITHIQPYFLGSLTIGSTYDFTIRIAAPQMELGAYATTFIPTTTAAVTRTADTFSIQNFQTKNLVTSNGGTWFLDLHNTNEQFRAASTGIVLSGPSGYIEVRNTSTAFVRPSIRLIVDSVSVGGYTLLSNESKIAVTWNGTTGNIFVNGSKVVSNAAFNISLFDTFIGGGTSNRYILNQMLFAPAPLTDEECITLTTL
jgi:hypothetical protein